MDLSQSTSAGDPHRKCPTCGTSYPRTPEFWWRDKSKDQGLDGVCKVCRNAATRRTRRRARRRDPISARIADADKRRRLRLIVLSHYSGGTPCCACCGESYMEFLAIDHVNGRGRAERGKFGRYGDRLYK
jgi:hypothetical protein